MAVGKMNLIKTDVVAGRPARAAASSSPSS
jgi:hypothetical protein